MPLNPLIENLPLSGDDLPDEAVAAIFSLLRERRQVELQNYKDRCLRRRIAKRLRACGARDLDSYLLRLAADEDELDLLLETLSVHVSRFFRDVEVFRVLEHTVLPDLCARLRAEGRTQLRLWSAGCAEGEEAYSLALLMDAMAPAELSTAILATDASEPVLAQARQGLYPFERLSDLPEMAREHCFRKEDGLYRLLPRIREQVEFQCHNLMAAGSYPPADLILCRNVLMYFSHDEQTRILERFAAALPAGGVLVLGRLESVLNTGTALFRAEFPRERIYRRLPDGRS